jgi:hypothetical protein
MSTAQTEFTEAELLADLPVVQPLIVAGVRCHGGFDENGAYVSPRTMNRWPAIEAWEEKRTGDFSTPLLDVPLDTWPDHFPTVEQSVFLLRHGVPGPTIDALTRIGTVEGFGGLLRLLPTPDFQSCFEEEITGTAIAHIDGGLFEAHARDESGYCALAGHDRMWFAARDIAFEMSATTDTTQRMQQRLGIGPSPSTPNTPGTPRPPRLLPADIDATLEALVTRMIGLLLIEISAFHGFRWAEAVLADTELVAGDGEAALLVSYIRADETPHVAWLRTALSEMRDRTWVGESGRTYPGADMIGQLWECALGDSLTVRRWANLQLVMDEIREALTGRADRDDLLDEMLSLGSVRLQPDGSVADPDPSGPGPNRSG